MTKVKATDGRAVIVGASGQVGTQMLRFLNRRFGDGYALPTARGRRDGWVRLDLATIEEVETIFEAYPIERIFCFGGMTNVDGCEDTPEDAWKTNARGPGVLAAYSRRLGIPFVYFSTEYVFDGAKDHPGPYEEDAVPHPLNVYGRSKLEGETRVLDACPEALVVRTTVVYGPDPGEKNYLYALMRNLSAGKSMRVPEDQVSTPTYNLDLIHTTFGLMEAGASGIFHVCGPEVMGRLAFARTIARRLGLDEGLLHGVSTEELGQKARRPLAAGLSTRKLRTLYPDLRMRTVADALEDAVPELYGYPGGKA